MRVCPISVWRGAVCVVKEFVTGRADGSPAAGLLRPISCSANTREDETDEGGADNEADNDAGAQPFAFSLGGRTCKIRVASSPS